MIKFKCVKCLNTFSFDIEQLTKLESKNLDVQYINIQQMALLCTLVLIQ